MKRLALILAGAAVAAGAAATPAVAGLAGNPSFSHEIPVPVPSAAKTPQFAVDHSLDRSPGGATVTAGTGPATEPGDDRGITPHAEPGDDRGGQAPHAEPGDDSGGHGGGRGGRG